MTNKKAAEQVLMKELRYWRAERPDEWKMDEIIRLAEKALSAPRVSTFCVWHNDPETDNSWDTGCSQLFELYDGSPSENRMSFCCYCGKPIQEAIDHARRIEGADE